VETALASSISSNKIGLHMDQPPEGVNQCPLMDLNGGNADCLYASFVQREILQIWIDLFESLEFPHKNIFGSSHPFHIVPSTRAV
jgi:hypothetical protein